MQLLAPLQAMHTGCFGFQPSISKDRALRASAAVSAALAEWAALSNCSPTTWAQRVVKLLLSCICITSMTMLCSLDSVQFREKLVC